MRTWTRRLLWLLAGLPVLALVALLAVWWLLRGSLPVLDGQRALPGLNAAASVERDVLGVVTVSAESSIDAARALGYVHAQERYFEMDLLRRSAAGELAELFGARALDADRRQRAHRIRARVREHLPSIAGERLAELQAYAEGVNAGLAGLRRRPWAYLLLRQRPAPWTAEDSIVAAYAMYFDLQDARNARELGLWRMQPHLPPALFALLSHDGSRWDAPLMGDAGGDAHLPGPELVDLRTLPAPEDGLPVDEPPGEPGSNNFAVAGQLTADGRAIVADDMHLGLRAPGIWFRARLRYADGRAPDGQIDVSGFTLPGLPAIIVGSNGHVAWGYTNSYADTADWMQLAPCDGAAPAAGCAPVREHEEIIRVAGQADEILTVTEADWGPLLHENADGSHLALRWVGHLPGAVNMRLVDLATAASLDQALAVATEIAIPAQNLVIGDRQGRIAWRLLGPIPQRGEGCHTGTLVESSSTAEDACRPWSADAAGNPSLIDPAGGRLWTANSRVVDETWLDRVGDGGYALGIRSWQIRDLLQARDRFTETDLLAIQLDDRARLHDGWHALLQSLSGARLAGIDELAALAGQWEGRAVPESVSYAVVRAWRLAVHERLLDGLSAPARAALGEDFAMPRLSQFEGVAWPLVQQRPEHLLPRRFASWDALLEDAARQVLERRRQHGDGRGDWGEQNTADICHPLAGAVPLIGRRMLCMPADRLPGDSGTPRAQGPAFGASQRMVVSPGHETDGIIHMPGGQSGHPLSPFWGAGHDDWVQGRASPFLPTAARHTLSLRPLERP